MLACLRMDDNPEQHGWLASQSGNASSQIIEGYPGNHVMQFTTVGSEAAPGPVVAFSWTSPAAIGSGTLLFDFRLDDLGPYTRVVIAEVDLGPRALRFLLQTQPRKTLILQWVTTDLTVLEERDVPEPSFFQQTRLLRLDYSLGVDARVTAFVEGKSVAEAPLGNDWVAAPPRVTFGAVDYLFPTSGAQFELDNLGFDAP